MIFRFILVLTFHLSASALFPLCAQPDEDRELLRSLSEQILALQTKVKELETKLDRAAAARVPVAEVLPSRDEINAGATVTPSLSIRGYGDLGYQIRGSGDARTAGFGLGQVDLFVTSRLSDQFGILMETVLENDPHGESKVDLERFLVQFRQSRFLNVDAGRYHSGIGYYNTAYHHGTWFQTAASRPRMFEFEDEHDGGLLPIHNIGLYFHGELPGRQLGLRYSVEIGNGRDYRTENVQAAQDNHPGKSVNIGLSSRPRRWSGLQLGASLYRDTVSVGQGEIRQHILAAYGVYTRGRLEVLTELMDIQHRRMGESGGRLVTHLPGLYSQWSYRLTGGWRPYARYEYANPSPRDPIGGRIPEGDVIRGSYVGGIRYDLTEFAAIKFEGQRILKRSQGSETRAAVNLSFSF